MINITKVVSRNFILDMVASFQNIVGLNLTSYEKMVNKGTDRKDKNNKKIRLGAFCPIRFQ